ncbi:MAG TPA: hypothetical protein VE131_05600, partial [Terriglobales bacterium]|nr:hypothetical protein [Terriglobales bacterium]
ILRNWDSKAVENYYPSSGSSDYRHYEMASHLLQSFGGGRVTNSSNGLRLLTSEYRMLSFERGHSRNPMNLIRTPQTTLQARARTFAFGFDEAGFDLPTESCELADGSLVETIGFNDARALDEADGVIVPQGIFERIRTESHNIWGTTSSVWVHKWPLLERERQVFNLLRQGKWICFLIGEITDEIFPGINREAINDTDLCKRLLNAFGVGRRHRYNLPMPNEARTRDTEFEAYVAKYGAAKTVLELPSRHSIERRILVELATGAVVGVEFDHQLFFLPFTAHDRTRDTVSAVSKAVAHAVRRYRQKWTVELPTWVDFLRFKGEESLYQEINSLLEKTNRLEKQLDSWRDYKAILTTSGRTLTDRIIAILESFFDFEVHRRQGQHGTASPRGTDPSDSSHQILFAAYSTESGSDEQSETNPIEELDAYRKRLGLPQSTPGLCIINHGQILPDLKQRLDLELSKQQVEVAKDHNILLIRTIDLLFFMQHMEDSPHRRRALMKLCFSGGGWLKADAKHFQLIG